MPTTLTDASFGLRRSGGSAVVTVVRAIVSPSRLHNQRREERRAEHPARRCEPADTRLAASYLACADDREDGCHDQRDGSHQSLKEPSPVHDGTLLVVTDFDVLTPGVDSEPQSLCQHQVMGVRSGLTPWS